MRRRWTVVGILVAAVMLLGGSVTLTWIARGDSTTSAEPTPAVPAASGPVRSPSGVATIAPSTPASPLPPAGPTPAAGIPAGLLGEDIERIPTSEPVVALTFDAGANADAVPSILETLATRDVAATFFLTGTFATTFAGSVGAIATAGHRIGNHTATHPHSLALSDAALQDQLATAEQQIRAAGGDPRPLFRFPFGERDPRTIAAVNAAGYVPVRWTVDSLGWQGLNGRTEPQATQFVTDRVLSAAQPGEIVLMHVGSHPDDHTTLDAAALPGIIDRLRADGYRFVTLDALLRLP